MENTIGSAMEYFEKNAKVLMILKNYPFYNTEDLPDLMVAYANECMPKWISVEDELPKSEDYVDISDGNTSWIGYYDRDGWAVVYDGSFHIISSDIKFWRKRPQPPKE